MTKITFIGDIMCEEPLLKASKDAGTYNFEDVFSGCKELFSESDYVIGNLETPLAGESAGYTKELFSFNTPDSFAKSMRDSGIQIVTTATNHALDRDIPGLLRTLDVLDDMGIDHIGTYRSKTERDKLYCIEAGQQKIGILNYSYGTNVYESPYYLKDDEYYYLNLLMPQAKRKNSTKGFRKTVSRTVRKIIPLKHILYIKKALHKEYANKYTDKLNESSLSEEYLKRIQHDITKAKEECDIVIVCLHIGGQFNESVGEQVNYFTRYFSESGADYLINTHAHVVQNSEYIGSTFVANCLGNFSISPSSVYVPHELKPEYSIALHVYIEGDTKKLTFSILKILEDKRHLIKVLPISLLNERINEDERMLLQKDVTFIYNRFLGKKENEVPLQKEYPIEV